MSKKKILFILFIFVLIILGIYLFVIYFPNREGSQNVSEIRFEEEEEAEENEKGLDYRIWLENEKVFILAYFEAPDPCWDFEVKKIVLERKEVTVFLERKEKDSKKACVQIIVPKRDIVSVQKSDLPRGEIKFIFKDSETEKVIEEIIQNIN